jgi:hypothetical protein
MKMSKDMKVIFIGIPSFILGISLYGVMVFGFSKILRDIQVSLYQRPEEMLYACDGVVIALTLFIPALLIIVGDVITRVKFPNHDYDKRKQALWGTEFHPWAIKFAIKLGWFLTAAAFILGFTCFKSYLALGENYVAYAPPALVHYRKSYDYSDVIIEKKKGDRGTQWEYSLSLDGHHVANRFYLEHRLVKDIQERQMKLGIPISISETPQVRGGILIRLLSLALAMFGLMLTLRFFSKNR